MKYFRWLLIAQMVALAAWRMVWPDADGVFLALVATATIVAFFSGMAESWLELEEQRSKRERRYHEAMWAGPVGMDDDPSPHAAPLAPGLKPWPPNEHKDGLDLVEEAYPVHKFAAWMFDEHLETLKHWGLSPAAFDKMFPTVGGEPSEAAKGAMHQLRALSESLPDWSLLRASGLSRLACSLGPDHNAWNVHWAMTGLYELIDRGRDEMWRLQEEGPR